MKSVLSNISKKDLPLFLGDLEARYRNRNFLKDDPIYHVHQYKRKEDQEIVAFISALLAFGNVKAIHNSVQKVLGLLGESPYDALRQFDDGSQHLFKDLQHRWVRGPDLYHLFCLLKKILLKHKSLGKFFLTHYDVNDPDIGSLLGRFSHEVRKLSCDFPKTRGYGYFFPHPEDGSPCKRLVLFMRWMVRPNDGIDLGLWSEIPASKLLIPLDLHVYRFGRRFQLSRYKNPNWKFVQDVTRYLKTLNAEDPIRFDFPICHYGMDNGW